jgi:hypothetical protein
LQIFNIDLLETLLLKDLLVTPFTPPFSDFVVEATEVAGCVCSTVALDAIFSEFEDDPEDAVARCWGEGLFLNVSSGITTLQMGCYKIESFTTR